MRDETLAGSGNVVRFPVERRTTLELLHGIAPDAREVSLLAETYRIAVPHDLQERVDQEAAEYILNQVPADGRERADMLRGMSNHAVGAAVAAVLGSQAGGRNGRCSTAGVGRCRGGPRLLAA